MIEESRTRQQGLNRDDIGHLHYLHALAVQPVSDWRGWYEARSESANYARRFQIAFSGYALAGLAMRTPAYRKPYAEALRGLIERMIGRETWQYWAAHDDRLPPDPIIKGNVQYSGHLSCLIGLYEKISGDDRYDSDFLLRWDDEHFLAYSHRGVAEAIHSQQLANPYHGVPCEPGNVYAPCNNHAALSNILYDDRHGTHMAAVNEEWVRWAKKHMFARKPLPLPQGVVSVVYMTQLKMAAPVSFNFTDAWGLAFMTPYSRELVEQHYPRFRAQFGKGSDLACLHSAGINDRMEISNTALNTGFAYVLAREMGDHELAVRLRRWADETLQPVQQENKRYYAAAKPAPYVTALFALGDALEEGSMGKLFSRAWRHERFDEPYLERVSEGIDVRAADYDSKTRRLALSLFPVGGEQQAVRAELVCKNIPSLSGCSGIADDEWQYDVSAATVTIRTRIHRGKELTLTL